MVDNDEQLEEMLYELSFSDEDITREKEIFARLGRIYKAGEVVVKEDDTTSHLFLVVAGSLKIVKSHGTQEEKAIAVITEGDIFGEMSYFDSLPRSATVIAAVDSELLVFEQEHFDMLFQIHPKWTNKIIQTLSNRIYLAYLDLKTTSIEY